MKLKDSIHIYSNGISSFSRLPERAAISSGNLSNREMVTISGGGQDGTVVVRARRYLYHLISTS